MLSPSGSGKVMLITICPQSTCHIDMSAAIILSFLHPEADCAVTRLHTELRPMITTASIAHPLLRMRA
jgi:hypothetical protein